MSLQLQLQRDVTLLFIADILCSQVGYTCSALALSSPIGALGGFAAGTIRSLSHNLLNYLGSQAGDPSELSTAAKVMVGIALNFASLAITFGCLAAAGFSLPLLHVVSLAVVSHLIQLPAGLYAIDRSMKSPEFRERFMLATHSLQPFFFLGAQAAV